MYVCIERERVREREREREREGGREGGRERKREIERELFYQLLLVIKSIDSNRPAKQMLYIYRRSHSQKLELCNLKMLELHRLHAHFIMVCYIFNVVTCFNRENCISLSTVHSTRGNIFRI